MDQIIKELTQKTEYRTTGFIISANGSSMIPTIVKGDKIHVDPTDLDFQPGDLIFGKEANGALIVHRVISTQPKLTTKGDNVTRQTEQIVEALGKVSRVEKTPRSVLRRIWLYAKRINAKVFSK